MIEFNLLPDIKLKYIKAQRQRRLVTTVAILSSLAAIVILVLLLSVDALQHKHLNDLSRDISSEEHSLQAKPNINDILTAQNQLQSLTSLHNTKPAVSRLFTYLNEMTPASVSINNLTIDFTQYTSTITGTADSLASINQYADTLKLTTYTTDTNSSPSLAFKNVVLSSFNLNTANKDKSQAATYSITLSYDNTIFDITKQVTLSVPSLTTRDQVQNPTDLFKPGPAATTSGGSK